MMKHKRIAFMVMIMLLGISQGTFSQLQMKQVAGTLLRSNASAHSQLATAGNEDAATCSGYKTIPVAEEEKEDNELQTEFDSAQTPAQVALAIISLMVAIVVFIANHSN